MAIFGGIAIAAVISSLILFASARKLIYWMHGAEGQVITQEDTTNQKPVTATA